MTDSPEIPDSSVIKENLTTDLVRRLRSENSMPPYYGAPKLQVEAAAEIERLRAALADPAKVHINMLAGVIAKPSLAQIIHIYGEDALRAALGEKS